MLTESAYACVLTDTSTPFNLLLYKPSPNGQYKSNEHKP